METVAEMGKYMTQLDSFIAIITTGEGKTVPLLKHHAIKTYRIGEM
jgi:hypothetical protein